MLGSQACTIAASTWLLSQGLCSPGCPVTSSVDQAGLGRFLSGGIKCACHQARINLEHYLVPTCLHTRRSEDHPQDSLVLLPTLWVQDIKLTSGPAESAHPTWPSPVQCQFFLSPVLAVTTQQIHLIKKMIPRYVAGTCAPEDRCPCLELCRIPWSWSSAPVT